MSNRDAFALDNRFSALFAVDLRSLAAMRIMGALTFLWVLFVWAPDLEAFFTDDGLLKRSEFDGRFANARISILFVLDGWIWAAALWCLGLISALCLLIGYRARLAALIAWLVYLSFVGRNPMLVQGGDILLPLLLFWMIFLPVGAVFSMDAALLPRNRRGEGWLSVASIGLLLQVLYVYVFGALLKTGDAWIPNGSAVYAAMHIDTFVTPLGELLRPHLITMQLLTFFVFYLELWTPLLLFFPDRRQRVRAATLALLIPMHLGFRTFLHIGHFWLASLTSLCAYIPRGVWNWLGERTYRSGSDRILIYYDRDCGFCLKVALILREFFLPRAVPVTPAQDDPIIGPILDREVSWVVVDHLGGHRLRWDAVAYVMSRTPWLAPFGWLAALYGAVGLGDPTYKLIGDSRRGLGRLTSKLLSPIDPDPRRSLGVSAFLSACIVFAFVWNYDAVDGERQLLPFGEKPGRLAQAIGHEQEWRMFAPQPPTLDGWPILEAHRADGTTADIFTDPPAPVLLTKPDDVLGRFSSARWRAFVVRAWLADDADRYRWLGRLAQRRCSEANSSAVPEERFETVTIHFVETLTKSNYVEELVVRNFGDVPCGGERL